MENTQQIFASRVKALRLAQDMKQWQLGQACRVPPNYVCRWEQGHVPRGETLRRLALALHTSTDYLLGLTKVAHVDDATK